jgi:hypothetical protein
MATDSDYVEGLARLAEQHQQRLSDALVTLEDRITGLMATAPLKDGSLFDLEWAIQSRDALRKVIEDDYLKTVDGLIKEYKGVAASTAKMLSTYGAFTTVDPSVITQLQKMSFQGFQDIGAEYLDVVAKEVYQNTLTGRAFAESVKAVKVVQGGRLAKYAKQQVHDSLMQFDASVNVVIGKESGATHWKYVGRIIETTRPFCRKHEGKTFTTEEIESTWAGSWAGKASGDPFIVRGGYNCGHQFRPVFDAEADDIEAKENNRPKSGNFVLNDEIEVIGSSSDAKAFESAMSALSPLQLAAVNKLAKPRKVIANEGARGQYNAFDRSVSADPTKRGGSIVRHEYGHHVDYTLGDIFQPFSVTDTAFITAFDKQRKALNFHKSKEKFSSMAEVRDELYNVETVTVGSRMVGRLVIKNDELGNYSDVFDALSSGAFQKNFGGYGHGGAYFKKKDARLKEVFANLFALYGSPEWPRVKKLTPILADEFELVMGKI